MSADNEKTAELALSESLKVLEGVLEELDTKAFVRPLSGKQYLQSMDTAEVSDDIRTQDNSSYSAQDLMPVTLPDGEVVYCFDYSRIPFPISRLKTELSVTGTLGVGGMGTVQLAELCGMQFAYKRFSVRPRGVVAEDARASLERSIFESEVRAQKMCSGIASVPKIREAGRDNEGFYIVMDYLNGKNLKDIIDSEFDILTVEDRLLIAMGIAHNLDSLHRHNIVHRDVKSSNFQVTDRDVHLIDFGIAKVVGETLPYEREGMSYGTPAYMPPEVLFERDHDTRSDQFSMGVVLYELFTGRNPLFSHDEDSGRVSVEGYRRKYACIEDMMSAVTVDSDEVDIYCEVSEVVMKCLSKDPAKRHGSCGEVLHKLKKIYNQYMDGGE